MNKRQIRSFERRLARTCPELVQADMKTGRVAREVDVSDRGLNRPRLIKKIEGILYSGDHTIVLTVDSWDTTRNRPATNHWRFGPASDGGFLATGSGYWELARDRYSKALNDWLSAFYNDKENAWEIRQQVGEGRMARQYM